MHFTNIRPWFLHSSYITMLSYMMWRKHMKKLIVIAAMVLLASSVFAGGTKETAISFNTAKDISVVSREDGSGTRGAFIELFGIQVKNADGTSKDMTTKEAVIANKTDVLLMNIANDVYAIGYMSLGSLNNSIRAVNIDGVAASPANVKNGTYKVSRPFNLATVGTPSGVTKDFIDFILSREGQAVIAKGGYIAINDAASAYTGPKHNGKIVVAGSSSVSPIMEKLKEAYIAIQPNVIIEIQMSDSTAGMTGTIDGTCNIGMASRALKDSEKAKVQGIEIALDGIAVIVHMQNPTTNLTKAQVKNIFTGLNTKWNQL